MIRVGIFTDNDFGKVNGVTTSLRAALAHAPADVRLRVYTCDSAGSDGPDYFAVKAPGIGLPFYSEMKVYAAPFRRFLAQARKDHLDLIHLTTPGPVGLAAMWVSSRLQLPMIGSFHTHLAEYTTRLSGSKRAGQLMAGYLRWSYGKCQQILAPSGATRDLLVAGQFDAEKIQLWTRGVSTTMFDPARRSDELRREWGVSSTCPAVLYVGRLSKEKGLMSLRAVQQGLRLRGVEHRLIVVGDGPMRAELEDTAFAAVFTGTLPQEDVARVMASADVFVFPSRTDTAGNVVLEAQASGLPVLVTDEGGPKENMIPGETGIVCASDRELSRQVLELCVRTERRQRLSRAARQYALTRSWESALEPLYRSYRQVAAPSTAPAIASGVVTA